MPEYEATIHISSPPDAVFPFMVEPAKLKLWLSGFVESRPLTQIPIGVGAKSVDTFREGSRTMEMETEIVRYEPPSLLEVAVRMSGMDARSEYLLKGDATTVLTHRQELQYAGLLRLAGPLMGGMIRKRLVDDLSRLKAVVERGAGTP